ncbi:MAG: helicase-associated domain-containing protein [Planctomycetes bacterium]|nr:helicase-associated domain-containing protein [Planctomycetota bacterium]
MTRLSLRVLLQGAGDPAVRDCVFRWCGALGDGEKPSLARAAAAMEDEAKVTTRLGALPRKLQDLLEAFFADDGSIRSVQALFGECGKHFKSRFELEAALAGLQREAFVWHVRDRRWASLDSPSWAVPGELVETVRQSRQKRQRQLQDLLTLQGFLDARFFRERAENGGDGKAGKAAEQKASDHARKIYKLYTMESAMAQRLGKLPAPVRTLVDAALHTHGGIAPIDELLRATELADAPDLALVGKCLEEAMLGTTQTLDLARIGIQPVERAVVVFHEVALWAIKQRGEDHPPTVSEELRCGGDFATNIGRFLRELQNSKVLFTGDGELFKASAKRIAGILLPVPGGFLSADGLLETIYRFCLQRRLIDRRGERALRPTPAGSEFDRAPLAEQMKMLLAHFVEDRTLPGESYHHTRMRRVLLRLLRRAEPMQWQDVAVLPFLSRNAYLAQLEMRPTEEFFAARFQGGGYTPGESLQQMCWNLLVWIKRRLFPLGLVDIGQHQGRVVALRLSRLGAELLEAEPAGKVGGTRCAIIVQPDFEVLVFPGDDVHDVVHLFDRFAVRVKSDHVHQFRIDQASLRAGLADGLTGPQIVQELTDRARVPIPQNVLYSLEEWTQKPPS